MGTQRPSWTIFDTVPNINMSDRKLQPGRKISRDPSPRPAQTAPKEREGDSREGERRRERDTEWRRYKDSTEPPWDRYADRDRGPRIWDSERDWRQKNPNVRPLSNIEIENEKEGDRGARKGDTFPRNARYTIDQIMSAAAVEEKERRQRRREEKDRLRQREEYRSRLKHEIRGEILRDREFESRRRDVDGTDRRDRGGPRKNDKQRDTRQDRNMYWDKAQSREGKRDTRSEGEIDEREMRRERGRDRDKEELMYQHSRSEGDTQKYRDQDRYRYRYRDDRYKDSRDRDRPRNSGQDERRREEKYRVYDRRRPRESTRETGMKEVRVQPRGQSSGEWSSDIDSEGKVRKELDDRERREKHRYKDQQIGGKEPGRQRKMWLSPQRGTNRKDTTLVEESEDQEGSSKDAGVSVDGEDAWAGGTGESGDNTEDSEGGDPAWMQDRDRILSAEDGFVTLSSNGDEDEEDREEDFKDCVEYWEEDRNTDGEWKEDTVDEEDISQRQDGSTPPKYVFCVIGQTLPRTDKLQVDDGIANNGTQAKNDLNHEYDEVREIVQDGTSNPGDHSAGERKNIRGISHNDLGTIKRDSQTERLLLQWREKNNDDEKERLSPIPSNPYKDVPVQIPYEQIQSTLEQRNSGTLTPEEKEAIRIRMSGAWSMSDEPKRHSQAPHMKWAKNVVSEILGQSDENIDNPKPESKEEKQAVEIPVIKTEDADSELEEEEEHLEVEGMRGMRQADMHADLGIAVHGDTTTHTENTWSETESNGDKVQVKTSDEAKLIEAEMTKSDDEVEYLSVSNTLYKPNSCPSLNYEPESDVPETEGPEVSPNEEKVEEGEVDSNISNKDESEKKKTGGATLVNSCSFRDLGASARVRRRGIRKTTERRKEDRLEEESEEQEQGPGRDRRTRIFSTSDDEDGRSKSWGELDLRHVLDSIGKRKRNSKFFNAAQLYQQYSEAVQNFEILRQSRSDVLSVGETSSSSPAPSPSTARRPLPPLPSVPHPHSLSHTGSVSSVQSLSLPEPPSKGERRASSPRLSITLTQSSTLWRDLPAVRSSLELQHLSADQKRLQEVRFEVVTSEASYCRSLDIVVDHFVKSKQLGALLTTQDRNWLFSRLADVRAISHSFLAKLEEKVESDTLNFTVCDVIAQHCHRFKIVYVPYLTNQSYQDATYQRLMNENPGFKRIVEKLERNPVCQRLPLRSFLVLPFQRITRIKLLVQNIVKRTTPGTPEATQAIKALRHLEKLIQEGNDSITQMKSIESLVSLSAKVDFSADCRTLPLISQSRRLVREGKVTELMDFSLKETERGIYMHLFNDYLLISIQKEGGKFTVIDHSPVSELRAENCRVKLLSLQKNLFRLHMSNRALLLRTDTQCDKLRWISALSRPHPKVDFSTAQDFTQMQCIRAFVAQQPDELSLEKADIILVQQNNKAVIVSSDEWVEVIRLSDGHRGWVPVSHLETITNAEIRQRNLSDALKLTTATADLHDQTERPDTRT